MEQEKIALGIVFLAVLGVAIKFYRLFIADPLSRRLLKCGRVKLAMRVRSHISRN